MGRAWADAMTWCYDHGDRLAWCVVLAQFAQEVCYTAHQSGSAHITGGVAWLP